MRRNMILAPFLLSFIFVSCMQQPDVAVVKKTIEEFNAVSTEAMKTGDTEKSIQYYTEDAVSMPPNYPFIKGRAAIKNWMTEMSQSGVTINSAKFTSVEVDASGKIAYEVGEYDMSMTIPGMGEISDQGKYVSIWKQQADGSWKVHAEIWNTSSPMPSMEPPMKEEKASKKK
jgi:uncharacterized protein (TIGR02246 family)